MNPRQRILAAVLISGHLLASPLRSQAAPVPERPCAFDTSEKVEPVSVVYSLMPEILSSADSVDHLAYLFYAQTVGEHFSAPRALTLAYLPTRQPSASPTMDDLGLGGDLKFKLDSRGHLKLPISVTTTAPELNEALARALLMADSAGELSPTPATPDFADGIVRLRISASRERPPVAVPLLAARLRVLLVDSSPQLISYQNPKYPKGAQYAGVSGRVVLRFVVGESGGVIPSTMQVVEAEYREFIDAAVAAMLQAKFAPAEVSGCAVPMQVQQALSFKILGESP